MERHSPVSHCILIIEYTSLMKTLIAIVKYCVFLESVSRTFEGVFEGKKQMLEKKLDTEHGLLDELEAKKVITSRHRTAVEVMFV